MFAGSAALAVLAMAGPLAQVPGSTRLALVGGTIYVGPTDAPLRDGVLLVQDGKIAAMGRRTAVSVPRTFRTLDCRGLTITAGFWNSHVHFFERKWADAASLPSAELARQLEDMLTRYGFTSVFDLGSDPENTRRIRDRIESGEVAGPRIRSTGSAMVAPKAVPPDSVLNMLGFMPARGQEVADDAQAAAIAKAILDAGADGIKVHLQAPPSPHPPFPTSAIAVAVGAAHRAGKPVFVHPNTAADLRAAARAGVDIVAHTTPRSDPWDEPTIGALKDARVALTPTLTLWRYALRHDRISAQEQLTSAAVAQLRAWVASGGTVLFGTDVGAVEYDPSVEYVLMTDAGMDFGQILASLTTAPAARFSDSPSGRIAPGLAADLVVLKGDPSSDIRALAAVRHTIRGGRIIYPLDR